jgi:hypothetical protein
MCIFASLMDLPSYLCLLLLLFAATNHTKLN